ncbi:85/88 kDa calcium-independent phospholipase A2-like [Saccostrea echinata]|uniref:85/88 kDa calcium-independent phospholipase A2-like n=1 Tax=Saccostrea echinata TaxID=191078 RepID=UPI002A83244D|nr:85/88 kDa calcium-independent phospholipase A2-like [Saccostrea echinata]
MHQVLCFARITRKIGKFNIRLPNKNKSGPTALFQRLSSVECMVSNNVMHKSFSIFRWTNDKDTKESHPGFDEVKLPNRSDGNKTNWRWRPAHVAAFLGLYECFHNKKFKKDINHQMKNTQLSPLMAAILGKHTQCVSVLLELGARLDLQDQNGETVYHYAVSHHPEVIRILAKHDDPKGSDRVINYLNKKGLTALATACQKGKPEIVQLLLDEEADPNITGQDMYPIHYAVKNGDTRSVDVICKKFKDQLSKRDRKYGGTPMHWARNRQMIEKFCRLKADMNLKSNTGHTPLHIMQEKDRTDCLIELLCWGADPSIGNEEGNTPIHIAVLKDDVEMVKIFVVCGADVNVKNKKNQSPRHLASELNNKNKELILYMLHISGALRCDENMENCEDGCSKSGEENGKVDGNINKLLKSDQSGPLDEMLSSVFDPLAQIDGSEKDPGYRILSLDGGGIRGLVQCLMLIAIEKEVGKPITECFDWIAGTSTGGLLTLGICTGKPLSYMRGLYIRLKDEVFTGSRPYESENFEVLLKEEFGEETVMTDLRKPRAVVTAVLADRHPTKLHLFRTYEPTLEQLYDAKSGYQRNGSTDKKDDVDSEEGNEEIYCPAKPGEQKVWEAARATGAAPTYFKAFGPYIDGGLEANNPALELLSEIHEFNCGLKLKNESQLVRPIGVMVSLGTGQVPVRPIDTVDVYKPEGIFDVTKIAHGIQNLINVMVDKATIAEGRPVDRARAWCGTLGVPFYRFSPPITAVEMDEHDNKKLTQLMWETQCYIVANQDRIKKLASFLRRDP